MVGDFFRPLRSFAGLKAGIAPQPCFCIFLASTVVQKRRIEYPFVTAPGSPSYLFLTNFKAHRDIYIKVIPRTKDCTPFWMGGNKQPLFPLYWTEEHYQRSLSLKELEIGFLEEEDQQTFRNLCIFVEKGGIPIHCKDVIVASRQDQATCLCRALSFIVECRLSIFYISYFSSFINKRGSCFCS